MSDRPRRHKKLTISEGSVASTIDDTPVTDVLNELLNYVEDDEEVIAIKLTLRKKSPS